MRKEFNDNKAPLPSGTALLIHAYENMPRPRLETPELNRALDVIKHWSDVVRTPDTDGFHTGHIMMLNLLYKNNFGTSSDQENWRLLTSLHPTQIATPKNLGKINDTIRKYLVSQPFAPCPKTTIKTLQSCILTGQHLTARLRNPKISHEAIEQEDILPVLKDICDAIELLGSDMMNLEPEITTALKNEILGPPLNPTGLKDYFVKQNKVKYGASEECNSMGLNKEFYKELVNRQRSYRGRPPFWK